MSYTEKRESTRFEVDRDVTVRHAENGSIIGHLENLSAEGMMLSSESSYEVGREFPVDLCLPTEFAGKSTVRCRVCSMWSGKNVWHETTPSKQYCTGFKITGIADTDLKTLGAWIRTLTT